MDFSSVIRIHSSNCNPEKAHIKEIKKPGVEVGGEVDEALKTELFEQIGLVYGERVSLIHAAPRRCLLLQRLHLSLSLSLSTISLSLSD